MKTPIGNQLYYYRAKVREVYDGDTFRADVDLGMNVQASAAGQSFRLAVIDTPELRGAEREDGLIVADYVRHIILDQRIIINTEQTGKFGRWLAWVFMEQSDILQPGESLNEHLLRRGYAAAWGEPWRGFK